ncbi:hypothetical protein F4677DRAFT_426266, partial [Hypoxylon crocopeplum]
MASLSQALLVVLALAAPALGVGLPTMTTKVTPLTRNHELKRRHASPVVTPSPTLPPAPYRQLLSRHKCAFSQLRCRNDNLEEICDTNGAWISYQSCGHCVTKDGSVYCAPSTVVPEEPACQENQQRCNNGGAEMCDNDGNWIYLKRCDYCTEQHGIVNCVPHEEPAQPPETPPQCRSGERQCNNNWLEMCDDKQTWQPIQYCNECFVDNDHEVYCAVPSQTTDNPTTPTLPPTHTDAPPPTNTDVPSSSSTTAPAPTDTEVPTPTETNVPPTETNVPPTETNAPPTETNAPPTETNVPPTTTDAPPPTNTDVPPPPTDTDVPPPTITTVTVTVPAPTDTEVPPPPPTYTQVPPSASTYPTIPGCNGNSEAAKPTSTSTLTPYPRAEEPCFSGEVRCNGDRLSACTSAREWADFGPCPGCKQLYNTRVDCAFDDALDARDLFARVAEAAASSPAQH